MVRKLILIVEFGILLFIFNYTLQNYIKQIYKNLGMPGIKSIRQLTVYPKYFLDQYNLATADLVPTDLDISCFVFNINIKPLFEEFKFILEKNPGFTHLQWTIYFDPTVGFYRATLSKYHAGFKFYKPLFDFDFQDDRASNSLDLFIRTLIIDDIITARVQENFLVNTLLKLNLDDLDYSKVCKPVMHPNNPEDVLFYEISFGFIRYTILFEAYTY